jgi:hypothetical protein
VTVGCLSRKWNAGRARYPVSSAPVNLASYRKHPSGTLDGGPFRFAVFGLGDRNELRGFRRQRPSKCDASRDRFGCQPALLA